MIFSFLIWLITSNYFVLFNIANSLLNDERFDNHEFRIYNTENRLEKDEEDIFENKEDIFENKQRLDETEGGKH